MWTISINSAINDGQNAHYDESCSSTLASTFSNGAKDPNTGVVSTVTSAFKLNLRVIQYYGRLSAIRGTVLQMCRAKSLYGVLVTRCDTTHIHARARTHTHTHTHAQTRTHTHIHNTYIPTHIHTHIHTRTHTCTRTHAHRHAHTYTSTQAHNAHSRTHRPATSWVYYTTNCNTQSSAPEDG